jgi:hypothetical protein
MDPVNSDYDNVLGDMVATSPSFTGRTVECR